MVEPINVGWATAVSMEMDEPQPGQDSKGLVARLADSSKPADDKILNFFEFRNTISREQFNKITGLNLSQLDWESYAGTNGMNHSEAVTYFSENPSPPVKRKGSEGSEKNNPKRKRIKLDLNKDGKIDHVTTINPDGTVTIKKDKNFDGVFDQKRIIRPDGTEKIEDNPDKINPKYVKSDRDGDGKIDQTTKVKPDGSVVIKKDKIGAGSYKTKQTIKPDGKGMTLIDTTGDGKYNLKIKDDHDGDGISDFSMDTDGDGKFHDVKGIIKKRPDGKLEIKSDRNGDGKFDIKSVIGKKPDGTTVIDTDQDNDGKFDKKMVIKKNSDGSVTTLTDADGDGKFEEKTIQYANGGIPIEQDAAKAKKQA